MVADILANMFRYRIILLCSNKEGKSTIVEVYSFLKGCLDELIPKLLQHEEDLVIEMFKNIYEKNDR